MLAIYGVFLSLSFCGLSFFSFSLCERFTVREVRHDVSESLTALLLARRDVVLNHRLMHPALKIPEILLDIFHQHCPPDLTEEHRILVNPDLVALATTCRTFKEPALDILWEVLVDLSPLARCLPEIAYQKSRRKKVSHSLPSMKFSFEPSASFRLTDNSR